MTFKIRQNAFPAGAPPRTPLGSSRRSPRPPRRPGSGHPSHTPPHSAPQLKSILPPLALATRRRSRFGAQIFSSRTAPGRRAIKLSSNTRASERRQFWLSVHFRIISRYMFIIYKNNKPDYLIPVRTGVILMNNTVSQLSFFCTRQQNTPHHRKYCTRLSVLATSALIIT